MILTGKEIERCVKTGEITIDPFKPECCNPNSYNFHIDDSTGAFANYIYRSDGSEDLKTAVETIVKLVQT